MKKLTQAILLSITSVAGLGLSAQGLIDFPFNGSTGQQQDTHIVKPKDACLKKRGCCSWHGGVCGCSGGRSVCCDGTKSPSCRC